MLRYALQTLRARRAAFVGAFLALLCASALVTACGALLETGLRGEIRTERYAGAPVVVAGDQDVHQYQRKGDKTKHKAKPIYERVWLPENTAERVQQAPGARAVVPELNFPAYLVGPDGHPVSGVDGQESLGHAWTSAALTPLTIERGHPPATSRQVVLDRGLADRAGLAPGDRVTVQATGAPSTYTVAGVAGELRERSGVFFAPAEARRLAGHEGQDAVIGVLPKPGVSAAELARQVSATLDGVDGVRVHTGADRGPVEFLDAGQARVELISMGGALGGTGLLVAVLVVAGTFTLSVQQRHRELALLRAVAATPRQVRAMIGREALVVGLAAGLLGALAGQPLAAWVHQRFVDFGTVPPTLSAVHSPFPAAAAVLATLGAAWAAARLSARRTSRIRPAQALTQAAVETRRPGWGRLVAGLLTAAGTVVLLAVLSGLRTQPAAMPVTYLVVLLASISLALLGPLVARAGLAVLGGPLRLSRGAGHLAASNTRAHAGRLAAVITPLTLLVAMACTLVFVQHTLGDAAERQTRDGVVADWAVGSSGPGVPGEAADQLRELPGVTAVTEVVHTIVRTPSLVKYTVQGVTPRNLADTLDPDVVQGSLDQLGPRTVAVSEVVADGAGLRPGSTLKLVLGDGTPVTLEVVAVYARGLGFGDLTLDHDLVAAHVDNPLSDSVLVATEAGRDSPGRTELAAALTNFPGTQVLDRAHPADQQAAASQENAEVSYLGMGLILAFTTIASVNSLAMYTSGRTREFALLRLAGMTRRQLLRMLRLEALSVALTAITLGTAISLAALTAFSAGVAGQASPSLSPGVYLTIVGMAAGLALVATAVPGRVALRERPTEALGA